MKQIEIYMNAALIGSGAVDAENLRPVKDKTGHTLLRPAGKPGTTALPDGWRPVARLGDRLIVSSGRRIGSIAVNSGEEPTISPVPLPGEVRCALTRDEHVIIMTSAGPVSIRADGTPVAATHDYPAISLLPVPDADISATVAGRELSRAYTGGLLEKKDREALVGDLAYAYRHICSEAAASGVMVQPALARYKLTDSGGNILFESPPVLLTHAEGAQCTDTVALSSADRKNVDGYTVSVRSWHLELVLPAADVDVARAEIFMTPLFHPFDSGGEGTATLMRAGQTGAPFCRVGLPGRENGLGDTYRDRSRRIVMQAIARIETLEERVAVIQNPFARSARIKPDISVDADPMAASARIRKALAKSVSVAGRSDVMLGAPHSFSAGCVAEASGAVAWGNIRALPYAGYPLGIFAAETADGAWSSHSAVYFGGTSGVERQESRPTDAPVKLGPVICYPLAGASSMTLVCYFGNQNHCAHLDLTTDASGRYAVYIAPGLRPFTPEVCAPTVDVTVTEHTEELPDSVAFAPSSRTFDIRSVISAGSGVVALCGHPAGCQAWDFGRSHFTLSCRGGIFRAGVNLNSGSTGLRTIYSRGTVRGDAVTPGDDGDIFVADGNICHILRNGRAEVFGDDLGYVAAAYDSARGELWALRRSGGIDVYAGTKKPVYFRYTHVEAEELKMLGKVFAVNGKEVYDTSAEIFDGSCRVRLHLRCDTRPDYLMAAVGRLHVALQASSFAGKISVEGSGINSARPWPIRRAAVSGTMAGPVSMALTCRPARAIDLIIEGDASEDFVFANACLKLE